MYRLYFDNGFWNTEAIDGVSRYIENPEWKKKQLEEEVKSLENQIQSFTNILSGLQQKLENKKSELKSVSK